MTKVRKHFFFEKKKQKTFISSGSVGRLMRDGNGALRNTTYGTVFVEDVCSRQSRATQLSGAVTVLASMERSIQKEFGPIAVAIPARDEAGFIAGCLRALDDQAGAQIDHIVLCVNNTADDTAAIARRESFRPGTTLHVLEPELPPGLAHAGQARRLAMEHAATLVGDNGIILTTDADAVVDQDWLFENLAALDQGADAVAGWVDLDPVDSRAIPEQLHADDARECAYDDLCDEIHARLDPDPHDPLPRHTQHSGASIAVTARIYAQAGGLPANAVGEDRAFFQALRNIDARIRHAPGCHVTVSGRTVGRATGGMADTIRRRLTTPDEFLDDRLEPADDCARRAELRQRLRACVTAPGLLRDFAEEIGVEPEWLLRRAEAGSFGAVWAELEHSCEVLERRRVAVADLPVQMARAEAICRQLRHEPAFSRSQGDLETAA